MKRSFSLFTFKIESQQQKKNRLRMLQNCQVDGTIVPTAIAKRTLFSSSVAFFQKLCIKAVINYSTILVWYMKRHLEVMLRGIREK